MKNLPHTLALLALLSPLTSAAPVPGDHATEADLNFRPAVPDFGEQNLAVLAKPEDLMLNDQRENNNWEMAQKYYAGQHDLCDGSRFRGSETNPSSPLAQDCLALADSLWEGGAHVLSNLDWGPSSHQKLFTSGTCAFGVHIEAFTGSFWAPDNFDVSPQVAVGNYDIIDAILKSIEQFQSPNGRVGAQGSFNCHGTAGAMKGEAQEFTTDYRERNTNVVWQIYHAANKHQWNNR